MDLRAYLLKKNQRPSAFADEVGINPSTISRFLAGKTKAMRLETVLQIIKKTGGMVSFKDLRPDLPEISVNID